VEEKDQKTGRHKAEAIAKKKELDVRHNLHENQKFDFQGGVLKYHQWISAFLGLLFVTSGMVLQQGTWIYFYIIGLGKILKDTFSNNLDNNGLELKPLIYYLVAALLGFIVMSQAGFPLPDMSLGLIANLSNVVP